MNLSLNRLKQEMIKMSFRTNYPHPFLPPRAGTTPPLPPPLITSDHHLLCSPLDIVTIRKKTCHRSSAIRGRRRASVRPRPREEDAPFVHCWFGIELVPAHHCFCHSRLKVFRFVTSCFNPWQENHVCCWRRERLARGRIAAARRP